MIDVMLFFFLDKHWSIKEIQWHIKNVRFKIILRAERAAALFCVRGWPYVTCTLRRLLVLALSLLSNSVVNSCHEYYSH